jgi:ubiquinone/menaquinone biosynthesis C-methylase UbiE
MKKGLHENDYERRIKAKAQYFSYEAEAAQKNSDKVERFSPKVPGFDEAMRLYQHVFYEKIPHMVLEKYILDHVSVNQKTKIVSLGCGTGDWEVALVEKSNKISMDLVEINSELLKYVKDYSEKKQLNVNTII